MLVGILSGALQGVAITSYNDAYALLKTLTPEQNRRIWARIIKEMGSSSEWMKSRLLSLGPRVIPADWVIGALTQWHTSLNTGYTAPQYSHIKSRPSSAARDYATVFTKLAKWIDTERAR